MKTTYQTPTEEFLEQYGITSETEEFPYKPRDAEDVQACHRFMEKIEKEEQQADGALVYLRFKN